MKCWLVKYFHLYQGTTVRRLVLKIHTDSSRYTRLGLKIQHGISRVGYPLCSLLLCQIRWAVYTDLLLLGEKDVDICRPWLCEWECRIVCKAPIHFSSSVSPTQSRNQTLLGTRCFGGMSYCNQTPFPPCEGWGLGTRLDVSMTT